MQTSALSKSFKVVCVGGARPNFMKLAPLIRALRQSAGIQPVLVHTGQHYDDKMSGQFFRELEIPEPDYRLEVGSGSHAQQTAEIMKRFEPVVLAERPDAVVVVGDVNSTAGCALVASKLRIPVVHVEAGLRSFDRGMPEEINRLVTDTISDLLLVTEESGIRNLQREGVPSASVRFVGNLMIDTLYWNLDKARQSRVLDQVGVREKQFGLLTLHRPANVDDPETLAGILAAAGEISQQIPLLFPVHPRTRHMLDAGGVRLSGNIRLHDPMGYLDFVKAMSSSAVVLTDSGGIQEETTALGIPCLTLRDNTERPVTITEGTNRLAGTTKESILAAWHAFQSAPKEARVPKLWDGNAAVRCVNAMLEFLTSHSARQRSDAVECVALA